MDLVDLVMEVILEGIKLLGQVDKGLNHLSKCSSKYLCTYQTTKVLRMMQIMYISVNYYGAQRGSLP